MQFYLKGGLSNVVSTVVIPTEPTPESTTARTTIFLVSLLKLQFYSIISTNGK